MSNIIVDIGGTLIRFGTDSIMESPVRTVKTPYTKEELLRCLKFEIQSMTDKEKSCINRIFISCPGLIDRRGRVQKALYVPLTGVNLAEELSQETGKQTIVLNDANVQAVGCWTGRNLLYISIGTAIGGAYIHRNCIFNGSSGFACEFGHIDIGSGIKCACGRTGCLDTVASGQTFINMFGDKWWENTEEPRICQQVGIAGENVGKALAQLTLLFEPEEVCVTGKVASELLFQEQCNAGFMKNTWYDLPIRYEYNTWLNLNRGFNKLIKGECKL